MEVSIKREQFVILFEFFFSYSFHSGLFYGIVDEYMVV